MNLFWIASFSNVFLVHEINFDAQAEANTEWPSANQINELTKFNEKIWNINFLIHKIDGCNVKEYLDKPEINFQWKSSQKSVFIRYNVIRDA